MWLLMPNHNHRKIPNSDAGHLQYHVCTYLEMQYKCPREAKDELWVAIDDFICSNVD